MTSFTRKQVLSIVFTVLFIFVGVVLYQVILDAQFRVVGATPDIKGTVSTSTNGFRIKFNRTLDQDIDYMQNLSDPDKQVHDIVVEETSLLVLTEAHNEGRKYKFEIANIKDVTGSLIRRLEFNYSAKFVAFARLSKEHQQLIEEIAKRPLSQNPILGYLPHSTLNFKLDREFADEHESGEIGDFVLVSELYLSAADIETDRTATIERYKQEVRDYISSLGFNPDDYTIIYREVEL